jgi:hypothetical protein
MTRVSRLIHSLLWLLLGVYCLIGPFFQGIEPALLVIVAFGALSLFNASAAFFRWPAWKLIGPVVGVALILYALVIFFFGHDLGSAWLYGLLIIAPLSFGVWSLLFPFKQRPSH